MNCMSNDAMFDDIGARTCQVLADQGCRVLTERDVEMPACRILGACNLKMAHQAIGIDPSMGAMPLSDVILCEVEGGVEVRPVNPVASTQAIDNAELTIVAGEVRDLLAKPVETI